MLCVETHIILYSFILQRRTKISDFPYTLTMRRYTLILAFVLFFLLACELPLTLVATTPTSDSCLPKNTQREEGRVIKVVDGDTIDVRIDGIDYRVRYIGIDTPELNQAFYYEATDVNKAFVENQQVTLIKDVSETDQYGRLLRYVVIDDVFVNYELVRQGYAAATTFIPDVVCSDVFVNAEREAREGGYGLWAKPPIP